MRARNELGCDEMSRLIIAVVTLLSAWPSVAQRPAQGPMSDEQYTPEGLGYELVWQD